jgi:hypothetical protein
MVQHRKDPETFFVRNTSRNANEKDLLKQGQTEDKGEEVAAYNPYPLHKEKPGLYKMKVHTS